MFQVQEARAVNGDLETRVSQLTTSYEKLLDSEGRWYSLARELENQMDVIKKVNVRRMRVVSEENMLVGSSSSAVKKLYLLVGYFLYRRPNTSRCNI